MESELKSLFLVSFAVESVTEILRCNAWESRKTDAVNMHELISPLLLLFFSELGLNV